MPAIIVNIIVPPYEITDESPQAVRRYLAQAYEGDFLVISPKQFAVRTHDQTEADLLNEVAFYLADGVRASVEYANENNTPPAAKKFFWP